MKKSGRQNIVFPRVWLTFLHVPFCSPELNITYSVESLSLVDGCFFFVFSLVKSIIAVIIIQ